MCFVGFEEVVDFGVVVLLMVLVYYVGMGWVEVGVFYEGVVVVFVVVDVFVVVVGLVVDGGGYVGDVDGLVDGVVV